MPAAGPPGGPRMAWPLRPSNAPPKAHVGATSSPFGIPTALSSAETSLESMGVHEWEFVPSSSHANARVTLDLSSLVRMLTAPTSVEQRQEWARHLVLRAQERLPDAPMRNLYTSIGREGWYAHRLRQKLRRSAASSTATRAGRPASAATLERESLASEILEMARMMRGAMEHATTQPYPDKRATFIDDSERADVAAFSPDVLRAGRATIGTANVGGTGDEEGSGEVGYALSGSHAHTDTAVLVSRPTWTPVRFKAADGQETARLQVKSRASSRRAPHVATRPHPHPRPRPRPHSRLRPNAGDAALRSARHRTRRHRARHPTGRPSSPSRHPTRTDEREEYHPRTTR